MTSLFANQRETTLASTVALVEQALSELGHAPATSRLTGAGATHAWRIVTGSAVTHVTVVDHSEFPRLRVASVVMTLDAKVDRTALFAHLLEKNASENIPPRAIVALSRSSDWCGYTSAPYLKSTLLTTNLSDT